MLDFQAQVKQRVWAGRNWTIVETELDTSPLTYPTYHSTLMFSVQRMYGRETTTMFGQIVDTTTTSVGIAITFRSKEAQFEATFLNGKSVEV